MTDTHSPEDALARKRYILLNLMRIGSLALLLFGLLIARTIIDLPYELGVVCAVGGLLAFYFGPRALARKWKSTAEGIKQ